MATSTAVKSKKRFRSRAVLRTIEAGTTAECEHCGERVKFMAKVRKQQVICNVYVRGRWDRVEHYHAECYELADEPYGEPALPEVTPRHARSAAS
jgi:DNA-directed RNA polymerase subunit RPC12/RpoP